MSSLGRTGNVVMGIGMILFGGVCLLQAWRGPDAFEGKRFENIRATIGDTAIVISLVVFGIALIAVGVISIVRGPATPR